MVRSVDLRHVERAADWSSVTGASCAAEQRISGTSSRRDGNKFPVFAESLADGRTRYRGAEHAVAQHVDAVQPARARRPRGKGHAQLCRNDDGRQDGERSVFPGECARFELAWADHARARRRTSTWR
jgi:hypothetical protein